MSEIESGNKVLFTLFKKRGIVSTSVSILASHIDSLHARQKAVIQKQEQKINALKEEFKPELDSLNKQLRDARQEMENLQITDWVQEMGELRPQIIPLRGGELPVILVRPLNNPEFAFMLFAKRWGSLSAQVQLSLSDGSPSPVFSIVSSCLLGKDSEDKFARLLDQVCEANGIETVFLIGTSYWQSEFPPTKVNIVEVEIFYETMVETYDHQQIQDGLSWMHWCSRLPIVRRGQVITYHNLGWLHGVPD